MFYQPKGRAWAVLVVQSRSWNPNQWWPNNSDLTLSWKIHRQAAVTARTFKMYKQRVESNQFCLNTNKISNCVYRDCALHQPTCMWCCCTIYDPGQPCITMFSLLKIEPSARAVSASGNTTLVHASWAELERFHGLSYQLLPTTTAQAAANLEHSGAHHGQTTLRS